MNRGQLRLIIVFAAVVVGLHVVFFMAADEDRLRNVTNDVVTTDAA